MAPRWPGAPAGTSAGAARRSLWLGVLPLAFWRAAGGEGLPRWDGGAECPAASGGDGPGAAWLGERSLLQAASRRTTVADVWGDPVHVWENGRGEAGRPTGGIAGKPASWPQGGGPADGGGGTRDDVADAFKSGMTVNDELDSWFGYTEPQNRSHNHCSELADEHGGVPVEALQYCTCNKSKPMKLKQSVACPEACPFSQNWTGNLCFKVCVFEDACGDFHLARTFASRRIMQCVPPCGADSENHIPGCAECGDIGVCSKCHPGLHLIDDGKACVLDTMGTWRVVFVVLGVIAALLVWYLAMLCCRTVSNEKVYIQGMQHYYRCLPWTLDPEDPSVLRPKEVYGTNMMRLHDSNIGTALFFRWMCFMVFFMVVVTGPLYAAFHADPYAVMPVDGIIGCDEQYEALGKAAAAVGGNGSAAPAVDAAGGTFFVDELGPFGAGSLLERALDAWRPRVKSNSGTAVSGTTYSYGSDIESLKKKFEAMGTTALERELALTWRIFAVLLVSYTISFVAAVAFVYYVQKVVNLDDSRNLTHKDLCVVVTGLPATATDPKVVEEYLRSWLPASTLQAAQMQPHRLDGRSTSRHDGQWLRSLGRRRPSKTSGGAPEGTQEQDWFPVVGVSIAYDYQEDADVVDAALNDLVESKEKELRHLRWAAADHVRDQRGQPHRAHPPQHGQPHREASPHGAPHEPAPPREHSALDPRLYCVDRALLQLGRRASEHELADGMEVRRVLRSLKCSGVAYAILRTQTAARWVLENAQHAPPFKSTGEPDSKLCFSATLAEPQDIRWEHHGSEQGRARRVAQAFLVCAGAIVIFFLSVIPPSVAYIKVSHVPGVKVYWLSEILLGLLPAIGGTIMCAVLDWAIEHIGYREQDTRENFLLFWGFIVTFLAVIGDLLMTLQIAVGANLDDSFDGAVMNFERVLARELYMCLVPGYVVCVAILSSNLETMLPWGIVRALVRAHPVTRQEAERWLQPVAFEQSFKYSDVLTGISAMLCMLPLTSPRTWKTTLVGVFMLLYVYVDTHWKLVRCYVPTRTDTEKLCLHAMHWFVVPLTLLGGSALFWGMKCGACGAEAWWVPLAGAALYPVLLFAASWAAPTRGEDGDSADDHDPSGVSTTTLRTGGTEVETDYFQMVDEMQSIGFAATYFNTNPVHCLRARYLDLDEAGNGAGCDPFRPGKEHLILKNLRTGAIPRTFVEELLSVRHVFCRCRGSPRGARDARPPDPPARPAEPPGGRGAA